MLGRRLGNKDDGNVGARPREDAVELNKRKVYVGKIPQGTCEDDIRKAFRNFNVEKVYLRPFTTSLGFAFVLLDSIEAAAQAEQEVSGACINGSTIVVRPAVQRPEAPSPPAVSAASENTWGEPMPEGGEKNCGGINRERELFVGNLPSNVEEQDLVTLFEPFGIEKVVLKKMQKPGKKNFAFVMMTEKSGMAAALERLRNAHLRGSKISISPCKERSSSGTAENHTNDSLAPEETSAVSTAPEFELYVGGLPESATEADVREVCSGYSVSYIQMKSKAGKMFSFVGIKGAPNPISVASTIGSRAIRGQKVTCRLAGNPRPGMKNDGSTGGRPSAPHGGCDSWDSPAKATSPGGGARAPQVAVWNCCGDTANVNAESWGEAQPCNSTLDCGPPPLVLIDDPAVQNGIHSESINGGDVHDKQLFVDNLRPGIIKDEVFAMFKKFGVSSVYVKNHLKKSFAYVTLTSEDQMQHAINEMNGKTGSNGCPITVKWNIPKAASGKRVSINDLPPLQRIADNKEVHVTNLPVDVGEEDMLRLFDKYGVQEVHLTTSGAQPEGHVILSSAESAQKAVQDLNDASMCGKKLHLEVVVEQVNSTPPNEAQADGTTGPVVLFVANFPYSTKGHHLRELLENFDPQDILVMPLNNSQDFTRAYVSVPDLQHAEDAELELNNTFYYGRLIAVVLMGQGTVQEIAALSEPAFVKCRHSAVHGPGAKRTRSRSRKPETKKTGGGHSTSHAGRSRSQGPL